MMEPMGVITLYTDGASRHNPGKAACAWVVCDGRDKVLDQGAVYLGFRTNNEAEYQAVIDGLKAGVPHSQGKVRVRSDSALVVDQMTGASRVKAPNLRVLADEVRDLVKRPYEGQKVTFEHVGRAHEMIKLADHLCNECLDEATIRPPSGDAPADLQAWVEFMVLDLEQQQHAAEGSPPSLRSVELIAQREAYVRVLGKLRERA
jgi:ribonuclease HI